MLKSALSELRSETSALNKQYLDATRPWTSRRGIILNGEWTPEDTTQYTDEQKKSSKAATAKLELGQLALIGAQEALGLNKPVPPGTKEALQHVEGIYAERVRSGTQRRSRESGTQCEESTIIARNRRPHSPPQRLTSYVKKTVL